MLEISGAERLQLGGRHAGTQRPALMYARASATCVYVTTLARSRAASSAEANVRGTQARAAILLPSGSGVVGSSLVVPRGPAAVSERLPFRLVTI
jgi:hypothetical protein